LLFFIINSCTSETHSKADQHPSVISDPFVINDESDDELATMVLEEQPPTKPETKIKLKKRKKIIVESSDSEPEVKLFRTSKDGNSTDSDDNKKKEKNVLKSPRIPKKKKIL
jgi:hypothetical protein